MGTPVVLAGGVFRHHSTVLRDAIEAAIPHYSTGSAVVEPVHGAVLMAADLCGARPDTERLRSSGPDATYFETA